MDFSQEDLDINGAIKRMNNREKRIKELESTVLDLQSELARKKMSLTVACNRVEELEGKLKVAVGVLKPLANAENKIFKNDKNRTAANALKQIGEV